MGEILRNWVAGVDGCPGGWFRSSMCLSGDEFDYRVVHRATDLLELEPRPSVLAIDIPIGLPEAGSRGCDKAARKMLGRKGSSVFPAPIRPALQATSQEEASRITEAIDGRRVSVQAFAIYPKIREIDDLLQSSLVAQQAIYEVHPEVCFWAWSGGEPIIESKKKQEGQAKRLQLAEDWLGEGILDKVRAAVSVNKTILANDDVLDALAALWTACRISGGKFEQIPSMPPNDSIGLPMRMVY